MKTIIILCIMFAATTLYAGIEVGQVDVSKSKLADYKVELYTTYTNNTSKTFKLVCVKCAIYDKDKKVIGLANTNFLTDVLPGITDVAKGRAWINGNEPVSVRCFCEEH